MTAHARTYVHSFKGEYLEETTTFRRDATRFVLERLYPFPASPNPTSPRLEFPSLAHLRPQTHDHFLVHMRTYVARDNDPEENARAVRALTQQRDALAGIFTFVELDRRGFDPRVQTPYRGAGQAETRYGAAGAQDRAAASSQQPGAVKS